MHKNLFKSAFVLTIWIAFSVSLAAAFELTGTDQPTSLIPNTPSSMPLLRVIEDPQGDSLGSLYHLTISCSPSVKTFFVFEPLGGFCENLGFKGSAEEINAGLAELRVTSPSLPDGETASIAYNLRKDGSNDLGRTTTQTFTFATALKVKVLKDVVIFDSTKQKTLQEHILSIDPGFFKFPQAFQFELSIDEETVPAWLSFKISDGDLVLSAQPPANYSKSLVLTLTLMDKKSGLASRKVALSFVTVQSLNMDRFFIAFAIFFVSFCLVVVSLVAFCVVKSSSYSPPENDQRIDPDSSLARNVLSESITNWTNDSTFHKLTSTTRGSTYFRSAETKKTAANDSICELEALKNDLGQVRSEDGTSERSFADDSSRAHIIEFGNISQIASKQEAKAPNRKPI